MAYANIKLIPARKANDSNWMAITSEERGKVQAIDANFLKLSEIQKIYLDRSGLDVLQSSEDNSNLAILLSVLIIVLVIVLVVYYSRNMSKGWVGSVQIWNKWVNLTSREKMYIQVAMMNLVIWDCRSYDKKLYDTLYGIQFGNVEGPEGWVVKVD